MSRLSVPENVNITVGELVDEFLDDCRIRNLSDATLDWYGSRLRTLLHLHWNRDLAVLRLDEMKGATAALMEGRSPATVNGYLRCLKALLNYALDNDYEVPINPRKLRKAREPRRIPPCFTPDQVAALLNQPDTRTFVGLRNYTMMCLLLDVGVRLSELTGLRIGDINIPYVKVHGKGDKERIVAMSDVMVKVLRRYLRTRQSALRRSAVADDSLFPSRAGGALSNKRLDDVLKEYGRSAGVTGVRVSAHTFRFTYTSTAVRNGMPLTSLQICLGHTTLAMTRHYAVLNDTDAFEDSRRCSPLAAAARRKRR